VRAGFRQITLRLTSASNRSTWRLWTDRAPDPRSYPARARYAEPAARVRRHPSWSATALV